MIRGGGRRGMIIRWSVFRFGRTCWESAKHV
jgi:hypothetical protein